MARNRASMREGPLAELFRATEAAQRQQEQQPDSAATEKEPVNAGVVLEATIRIKTYLFPTNQTDQNSGSSSGGTL